MDPNANLAAQRRLVARITEEYDKGDPNTVLVAELGAELASFVETLDAWISKGGFLPAAWCHGGPHEGQ